MLPSAIPQSTSFDREPLSRARRGARSTCKSAGFVVGESTSLKQRAGRSDPRRDDSNLLETGRKRVARPSHAELWGQVLGTEAPPAATTTPGRVAPTGTSTTVAKRAKSPSGALEAEPGTRTGRATCSRTSRAAGLSPTREARARACRQATALARPRERMRRRGRAVLVQSPGSLRRSASLADVPTRAHPGEFGEG